MEVANDLQETYSELESLPTDEHLHDVSGSNIQSLVNDITAKTNTNDNRGLNDTSNSEVTALYSSDFEDATKYSDDFESEANSGSEGSVQNDSTSNVKFEVGNEETVEDVSYESDNESIQNIRVQSKSLTLADTQSIFDERTLTENGSETVSKHSKEIKLQRMFNESDDSKVASMTPSTHKSYESYSSTVYNDKSQENKNTFEEITVTRSRTETNSTDVSQFLNHDISLTSHTGTENNVNGSQSVTVSQEQIASDDIQLQNSQTLTKSRSFSKSGLTFEERTLTNDMSSNYDEESVVISGESGDHSKRTNLDKETSGQLSLSKSVKLEAGNSALHSVMWQSSREIIASLSLSESYDGKSEDFVEQSAITQHSATNDTSSGEDDVKNSFEDETFVEETLSSNNMTRNSAEKDHSGSENFEDKTLTETEVTYEQSLDKSITVQNSDCVSDTEQSFKEKTLTEQMSEKSKHLEDISANETIRSNVSENFKEETLTQDMPEGSMHDEKLKSNASENFSEMTLSESSAFDQIVSESVAIKSISGMEDFKEETLSDTTLSKGPTYEQRMDESVRDSDIREPPLNGAMLEKGLSKSIVTELSDTSASEDFEELLSERTLSKGSTNEQELDKSIIINSNTRETLSNGYKYEQGLSKSVGKSSDTSEDDKEEMLLEETLSDSSVKEYSLSNDVIRKGDISNHFSEKTLTLSKETLSEGLLLEHAISKTVIIEDNDVHPNLDNISDKSVHFKEIEKIMTAEALSEEQLHNKHLSKSSESIEKGEDFMNNALSEISAQEHSLTEKSKAVNKSQSIEEQSRSKMNYEVSDGLRSSLDEFRKVDLSQGTNSSEMELRSKEKRQFEDDLQDIANEPTGPPSTKSKNTDGESIFERDALLSGRTTEKDRIIHTKPSKITESVVNELSAMELNTENDKENRGHLDFKENTEVKEEDVLDKNSSDSVKDVLVVPEESFGQSVMHNDVPVDSTDDILKMANTAKTFKNTSELGSGNDEIVGGSLSSEHLSQSMELEESEGVSKSEAASIASHASYSEDFDVLSNIEEQAILNEPPPIEGNENQSKTNGLKSHVLEEKMENYQIVGESNAVPQSAQDKELSVDALSKTTLEIQGENEVSTNSTNLVIENEKQGHEARPKTKAGSLQPNGNISVTDSSLHTSLGQLSLMEIELKAMMNAHKHNTDTVATNSLGSHVVNTNKNVEINKIVKKSKINVQQMLPITQSAPAKNREESNTDLQQFIHKKVAKLKENVYAFENVEFTQKRPKESNETSKLCFFTMLHFCLGNKSNDRKSKSSFGGEEIFNI